MQPRSVLWLCGTLALSAGSLSCGREPGQDKAPFGYDPSFDYPGISTP